MSNITDLQAKINAYNTAFAEYFKSPDLLATLIKTFTSHNITIEDWNTVVQTVKDNLELTPEIKDIINNVEDCLEELYEYATDIQNKVTKTSTPNIVYGTDSSGNQINYEIDSFPSEYSQPKIPTIIVTQSMITGTGTGAAPYYNEWYRFNFGANNQYLADDTYDTIKLDITAIRTLLNIPTNYLYLKRNATNSDQGITLYQFFIDDSDFDYSHIQDLDPYIQIAQIGDAALIYEPTSGAGWLTNRNITPTDIYVRLGELEDSAEIKTNKVSSWQTTPTDITYPTEKLVWDTFQTQKEEINGKSRSLVLSYLKTAPTTDAAAQALKKPDGTAFDDLADFNDYVSGYTLGNGGFDTSSNIIIWFDFQSYYLIDVEGIVYLKTDLVTQFKTGDNVYITELQSSSVTNLPDRWMRISGGQISFYQLETAKVDLTSYVDLSSAQTITGTKNFRLATFSSSSVYDNAAWRLDGYGNSGLDISLGQTDGIKITKNILRPLKNNTLDLGDSTHAWKDEWLSNKLYFGYVDQNYTFTERNWYVYHNQYNEFVIGRTYNSVAQDFIFINGGSIYSKGNNPELGQSTRNWKVGWINTLKGVTTMTQAEYDAITPDANTLYFIEEE